MRAVCSMRDKGVEEESIAVVWRVLDLRRNPRNIRRSLTQE